MTRAKGCGADIAGVPARLTRRLRRHSKGGINDPMETNAKSRRKFQLRLPGRRTATGKNASLLLIRRNKVLYLFILPAFLYFLI